MHKRSIIRNHGNRHHQHKRRIPAAWTSVALMLILAASPSSSKAGIISVASAFIMPKLRVRSNYQSLAVWSTEDKKRVPIKDGANNNNNNDGNDGDNKILNGKKQPGETKNKDGLTKPPPAGTPLSMIVNETAEIEDSFEIHVGRALDTLKKDYPDMLTENPDFSIFDKEVEVIDPTGVKLHGIKAYKNAFRLIHGIVQVFYCPERSGLTFRMCYDTARQSIRVSWNAEVIPKAIFGGVRTTLHVDGISVYEISQKSGMITQHRIERLVMNDTPVRPQQGIFAMLRNEHDESLPVFNVHQISESSSDQSQQPHTDGSSGLSNALQFRRQQRSKLFDMDESSSTALSTVSAGENEGEESVAEDTMDWEAFERKNASRKKFGVKPLTPEEFMENEAAVRQMESQQRQRAASASAAAEVAKRGGQSRQQGFFEKLFGDIGPEACESNFDCVRPEICCDFGFKKICCASGTFVGNQKLEPALVPVPADMRNRGEQPPPNNNNNGY